MRLAILIVALGGCLSPNLPCTEQAVLEWSQRDLFPLLSQADLPGTVASRQEVPAPGPLWLELPVAELPTGGAGHAWVSRLELRIGETARGDTLGFFLSDVSVAQPFAQMKLTNETGARELADKALLELTTATATQREAWLNGFVANPALQGTSEDATVAYAGPLGLPLRLQEWHDGKTWEVETHAVSGVSLESEGGWRIGVRLEGSRLADRVGGWALRANAIGDVDLLGPPVQAPATVSKTHAAMPTLPGIVLHWDEARLVGRIPDEKNCADDV